MYRLAHLADWLRLSGSDLITLTLVAAFVTVASLAGGTSWPVWLGTLAASLIIGGWQIRQGNLSEFQMRRRIQNELAQRNRELSEANITEALRQAVRIITPDKIAARASLMLISEDNRLFIAYHHNMTDAPDHDLRFDKYQGCAGHAWALGEQTAADLRGVTDDELKRMWKLGPQQIALTRNLGSISCTPVRDPRNRDVIVGIFSVDSTEALPATGFDGDQSAEEALKVAEVLARLLVTGGIL